MTTSTYWKCIGLAVLITAALFLAVGLVVKQASASPPPGGFRLDRAIDDHVGGGKGGKISVYRFRDGPRVCYVAASEHAADTISCVVSP